MRMRSLAGDGRGPFEGILPPFVFRTLRKPLTIYLVDIDRHGTTARSQNAKRKPYLLIRNFRQQKSEIETTSEREINSILKHRIFKLRQPNGAVESLVLLL